MMFSKFVNDNKIPPHFLNSILTNDSLYDIFKNNYETNLEYFQNRNKEEYINAILEYIENKLFSKNIFFITENKTLDGQASSKVLNYIRKFYDDFLLKEFQSDASNIFKTAFFKGIEFTMYNDLYARESQEFIEFYNYVFYESLDYNTCKDVLLKPILEKMECGDKLSMSEFDIICNYIKNNIKGFIDMDLVTSMIKNHAYKTNHIFDRDVVKELINSTAIDYFKQYNIECEIQYDHLISEFKDTSSHKFNPNIITIDNILIDTFITGNYVELFNTLFYEITIIKNANLLMRNEINYETYKVIMYLIIEKVDLDRIFIDDKYEPYAYFAELKSSSFIKTLRFYQMLGVDLFSNYINNKIKNTELILNGQKYVPRKEISLEMLFQNKFSRLGEEKIKIYLSRYKVLNLFYDKCGYKRRTLDIIKKISDDKYKNLIINYIHRAIIAPEIMIEDVNDLLNYHSKSEEINDLVERILKYIYVDSFYYSLNSFIKLNLTKSNFNKLEYLDDLSVKVNCIKDTPLTHRFIDEALLVIEEAQQNS